MTWSMRRTLTLGLSLAIGVLALNALVTFGNIQNLIRSGRWVIHTREVLGELDELFASVQDAEAAQRGYLLTGEASYLERFESSAGSVKARIDHVRTITADNPRQQVRIPPLERQVQAQLDLLREGAAARRERGIDGGIRSITNDRGEQTMDELRGILAVVRREEESLLARRTSDAESSVWWTVGSFSVASLLAIALLMTTSYSIWSEAALRQRSAEAIRRSEQELRESEERFRIMADSIPQLAWMARPDGQVFWYNRRWYEYTGTTPEQMEGRGWQSVHDPAELPGVLAKFKAALTAGEPWEDTFPLRRHDGAMRWHLSRALPVRDAQNRVVRWFGTNTDITEQRQTEEALREAKDAAETASRSKSTFLANMSHELRTPLNAIIGYSEMLLEEAGESDQDRLGPDLQKVHAAGKHLLGLINDILDLSKIEAGKMDLFLETFEVPEMVRGVVDTVRVLVETNQNTLVVSCPEGLGTMHSDLTKVRQSLLNLLSNACKFTSRGTITLEAAREPVDARDGVILRVRDTGVGMTHEQVLNLFQPFTQADASTTRKYGGTGLGLTITRRFCQMMGGDISVESEPGRGTTFTIRLPAQAAEARKDPVPPAPAETRPEPATGPGGLVLVIDDDPNVRDMVRRTVEKEGFRVQYASGGEEGIRMAHRLRPDAITLDVMMPSMDGWAVLAALKSNPELTHIPVIMVTIVDDKNLAYSLGAAAYLTKPIHRKRLAAILDRYRPAGRALVVDDDENCRHLMRQILEKDGWSVMEAKDGREGLDRVADARPDLIILDLMMPEVDGFRFAKELSRDASWQTIPILVVTAKDLSEHDREFLHSRAFGILGKGSGSRGELQDMIRREVAGRARQGAADLTQPESSQLGLQAHGEESGEHAQDLAGRR
jgi:PAS domain S-box-containing protein